MTIDKTLEGTKLEISLEGRLDTMTAPQLEEEVKNNIEGIKELIFDLKNLAYVSSAGLRVLLSAQKIMNKQGSMTIRNANEEVMEIFEVTGFIDILNIEE
ncbi:MAG: STAS domain-containing protein [Lachnospiraceae bacterium]|nr:STAS domain-containing protein [Lachnospiraceae bacterium]